uniref:Uncharacterized protein n=1 Tax=Tanacetum cinerariifolium TaxID=118510 RepID=A0A699HH54_TANCI|nr:hypothetical protein [Tanacetum cinerariifolium]
MAFLTAVASLGFPFTNNQLRTSSNSRNKATIQDGRVAVQQVQGRQGQNYSGTTYKGNATSSKGNTTSGHTEDLDTYDSDCDDLSAAQAVLMANISNYGSNIISESRSKMFEIQKDPEAIKQNISHEPIDYEKLNRLTKDFGKRFTPQQELSTEQAFWLYISNPTIESSSTPPVRVEVPSELPKVSLVNESLKKLKFQLAQFDYVVKKRTTPNGLTEGELRFEHTKAVFNNEVIPFLKSLKNIFNVFDKDLLNEITKVQTIFDQMEAAVQQSSVDKQCLEIANKELLLENDRLSIQIMYQDTESTVMSCMSLNVDCMNVVIQRSEPCEKCLNPDAEFSKSKQASKPELQSMTSGHISSGLDLTYAPSTITTQQPSEGELDLLFEAMYDDYIGGQPSATARTILPAQEPQVRQSSTASTTIADTAPIPTNSSFHATNIPISSQDVDELNPNAMVDGNTIVNPFANSFTNAVALSSHQNVDPLNMHTFYQPYPYEFQWTKDHPLE